MSNDKALKAEVRGYTGLAAGNAMADLAEYMIEELKQHLTHCAESELKELQGQYKAWQEIRSLLRK